MTVLAQVSLELTAGETVVLQGPNGSGKTTLLRVVGGLTQPLDGEVRFAGAPIRHDLAAYSRQLLWYGHKAGLKDELTAIENLTLHAQLRHADAADPDEALRQFGIADCRDRVVGALSAGQKRRVALARLVLGQVPLWLLDEPFTNLDQAAAQTLHELIAAHNAAGGTCLLAAHALRLEAYPAYRPFSLEAAA